MALSRRQFLTTLAAGTGAFAIAGLNKPTPKLRTERWYLFGTLLDVTLPAGNTAQTDEVLFALNQLFQDMNNDWHPWKAGRMFDINSAIATGETIEIDQHLEDMIRGAQAIYSSSGGRFNPAIGKLVAEWGFHGDPAKEGEAWQPPTQMEITDYLQQLPTPLDLDINDGLLSSNNQAVKIDFGGYAKGYAIDQGMALLQHAGIEHAIINAGGDLVAMGEGSNGHWRVGIRNPRGFGSIAWLETQGREAVFTSGDYERYHEHNGKRFSHIIDPTTARPVSGIISSTVVHENAAFADAAATALSVAGPQDWRRVAENMGVKLALVVENTGRMQVTRSMSDRIRGV